MPRCGQNRAELFRAERPQLWRRYRSKYLQNLAQQNLDPQIHYMAVIVQQSWIARNWRHLTHVTKIIIGHVR